MSDYSNLLGELSDRFVQWSAGLYRVSVSDRVVLESDGDLSNIVIPLSVDHQKVTLRFHVSNEHLARAGRDVIIVDDIFKQASRLFETAIAQLFYAHYELIFIHNFANSAIRILEPDPTSECRFCNRSEQSDPSVSFRTEAHAVPESLGNKNLIASNECDQCNSAFGDDIENHFGVWSKWQRWIFGVKGKKRKFKIPNGRSYVRQLGGLTQVVLLDKDAFTPEFSQGETDVKLRVVKSPYIPVAVMKAFYKMALSVMPFDELQNFNQLLNWVSDTDHRIELPVSYCYLLSTFSPLKESKVSTCFLLRRRTSDLNKPYMTFVLIFGNFCYQVILPPPKDLQNGTCNIVPFSYLYDDSMQVADNSFLINMHSSEFEKREEVTINLKIFGPVLWENVAN